VACQRWYRCFSHPAQWAAAAPTQLLRQVRPTRSRSRAMVRTRRAEGACWSGHARRTAMRAALRVRGRAS
jgi:hypothetical protein